MAPVPLLEGLLQLGIRQGLMGDAGGFFRRVGSQQVAEGLIAGTLPLDHLGNQTPSDFLIGQRVAQEALCKGKVVLLSLELVEGV